MRLLAIALLVITFSCKNASTEKVPSEISNTEELVKIDLKIEGMTCTGCESTIESTILALQGVHTIDAVHTNGSAHITTEKGSLDTLLIKESIENAGYKVVSLAIKE